MRVVLEVNAQAGYLYRCDALANNQESSSLSGDAKGHFVCMEDIKVLNC